MARASVCDRVSPCLRGPACRDAKADPATDDCGAPDRGGDEPGELARGETTHDGDHSIVAAHRMEAEREGGYPNAASRHPAAANVTDDDANARDAVQLPDDGERVVVAKVV